MVYHLHLGFIFINLLEIDYFRGFKLNCSVLQDDNMLYARSTREVSMDG